ncbi:hypothetical protein VP01_1861g4 [Puccinia sorghi]|uniref:Uncharacterized protein n=1 Tax=Puccinia sorghi TaxID=27349 RepID=A0A0L6VDZ5_9BASI|nr:hypothetical protein VP01_1861g4 [Puccinia sorghi]
MKDMKKMKTENSRTGDSQRAQDYERERRLETLCRVELNRVKGSEVDQEKSGDWRVEVESDQTEKMFLMKNENRNKKKKGPTSSSNSLYIDYIFKHCLFFSGSRYSGISWSFELSIDVVHNPHECSTASVCFGFFSPQEFFCFSPLGLCRPPGFLHKPLDWFAIAQCLVPLPFSSLSVEKNHETRDNLLRKEGENSTHQASLINLVREGVEISTSGKGGMSGETERGSTGISNTERNREGAEFQHLPPGSTPLLGRGLRRSRSRDNWSTPSSRFYLWGKGEHDDLRLRLQGFRCKAGMRTFKPHTASFVAPVEVPTLLASLPAASALPGQQPLNTLSMGEATTLCLTVRMSTSNFILKNSENSCTEAGQLVVQVPRIRNKDEVSNKALQSHTESFSRARTTLQPAIQGDTNHMRFEIEIKIQQTGNVQNMTHPVRRDSDHRCVTLTSMSSIGFRQAPRRLGSVWSWLLSFATQCSEHFPAGAKPDPRAI